jgi:hypothetical protein
MMKFDKHPRYNKLSGVSIPDQRELYEEVLQRVIDDPRFYLDNLDNLWCFRVSFITYLPEEELFPENFIKPKGL